MTARALELIAAADVIFHDRLIPPSALAGARADAELVYVGKEPGAASVPQEQIEERLVELARAGRSVVRLKGGDPFVFGRGGEEAEALREAGVEFEVVPGVTAGVAAPAYAGIPITHREDASAVAFVTGHEDPDKEEPALDWGALAAFPGTLVLYMGVRRLAANAAALIAAGRPAKEPAAVVERGTMDGQRTVVGDAGHDRGGRRARGNRRPGDVVDRRRGGQARGAGLARAAAAPWAQGRRHPGPRAGQRARRRAAGARRGGRGAARDPDRAALRRPRRSRLPSTRIGEYAVVCLTSPNGVRAAVRGTGRSTGATPGRSPPPPSPRSGRAPPPPSPSMGLQPTSSPSASSPRPLPRPSRGSRSRGAVC